MKILKSGKAKYFDILRQQWVTQDPRSISDEVLATLNDDERRIVRNARIEAGARRPYFVPQDAVEALGAWVWREGETIFGLTMGDTQNRDVWECSEPAPETLAALASIGPNCD